MWCVNTIEYHSALENDAHPLRGELSKAAACELRQGPEETRRGGARREKEAEV